VHTLNITMFLYVLLIPCFWTRSKAKRLTWLCSIFWSIYVLGVWKFYFHLFGSNQYWSIKVSTRLNFSTTFLISEESIFFQIIIYLYLERVENSMVIYSCEFILICVLLQHVVPPQISKSHVRGFLRNGLSRHESLAPKLLLLLNICACSFRLPA
jgi:hypothetical protein